MLLENKILAFKNLIQEFIPQYNPEKIDVFSGKQSGYRMRAEFAIYHDNNKVRHYTHDAQTKERVFCNGEFAIATPLINQLMVAVEEFCNNNYTFSYKLFQVEYMTTTTGHAIVSLLFHRPLEQEGSDLEKAKELQNFLLSKNFTKGEINVILRARKSKILVGKNYIQEKFSVLGNDIYLYQAENSFAQPNAQINQLMLEYVAKNSHSDKDILELYCGVGNFTMVLAKTGRRVLATEVNKQAVDFVSKNLAQNHIENVQVGRISAEEFVQAMQKVRPFRRLEHIDLDSYDFETVFVDPPRSGLDNASCDMISKYEQIIYVSCNPHTLMPNLQYLSQKHGYNIEHLALFDQFPQTPHVESVALLRKSK